jgi:competence protein CoiA
MQIYAWDKNKRLIHSGSAHKHIDYQCVECLEPIRLRKGIHRYPHFFHTTKNRTCRLNGKSMKHLQVQYYLQNLLPIGECFIEYRVPEIKRIADVLWRTKKIVFEIQCSPIDAAEIEQRNKDYARLGWYVIWILHDECFNQNKVSGAELFLQKGHYYYTDMDAEGIGTVYDQQEIFQKGIRKVLTDRLLVHMNVLHVHRHKHRSFYFSGDRIDRILKGIDSPETYIEDDTERSYPLLDKIFLPFRIAFQIMLERACK